MNFYHVDILGTLPVGKLELISDYKNFDAEIKCFCEENFPQGISRMGFTYSGYFPTDEPMSLTCIVETVFELVRQIHFPDRPSRFAAICACRSFDSALKWKEMLIPNAPDCDLDLVKIHTLKCDSFFECDAFWRDNFSTDEFNPGLLYANAKNYWTPKFNDDTKIELLLPLPVVVLD